MLVHSLPYRNNKINVILQNTVKSNELRLTELCLFLSGFSALLFVVV